MARRLVWAPTALHDTRIACEFIARDSPRAARKFARSVILAGRSLTALPERGRVVPELADASVREIFISRYRLIYEVLEDRVAVLRVIHGSRDLLTAWRPRDSAD